MSTALNRVTLIGTCGKYGFTAKQTPTGAPTASGSIVISEQARDGKAYESFYPVECYGQHAEQVSAIAPGTPILIDGKLGKRKTKDGAYEVVVSCYDVRPLTAA